jgi:hypothetical protein
MGLSLYQGMALHFAEKLEKQIPRRLEPARDDKNEGLGRGAEAPHHPNKGSNRVFQQTVKPMRELQGLKPKSP